MVLYVQSMLDLVNIGLGKNLHLVKISLLIDLLLHKKHRFSELDILVNLDSVNLIDQTSSLTLFSA